MFDSSDETQRRPGRGETFVSNALEMKMTPPWKAGEERGDYVIGKLLGRGQAGFVYSAEDLVVRRRCALKVLCRNSSQDLYRNKLGFRRMSPFRHPCLVRTDRIDVIDGFTVLSMEEIQGKTLYETVRELKKGARGQAYARLHSLLHDYAVGLAIIHLGGVVHRDLKPTNLMVRDNGHGVIVDYGLVANCDPETDPHGIRPYIAGTPRYFSPEALWEQSYTPAGDVFSLGLVMLDCLNAVSGGNAKWEELRQGDFFDWDRDEDEEGISDAVSHLDSEVPQELRRIVTRMLSVSRANRPSSPELVSMTKRDDNPIRLITDQHLYGRHREQQDILDWLRDICRGRSGRLHLHGKAGCGKTRLLDEIERQLKQVNWVQVFRVKCRSRETQTLQVLDQIADQIAARYTRRDREKLELDAVSATILVEAFPQLKHVIKISDPPARPAIDRAAPQTIQALEASRRLSSELRKVGPLIIIVDDAQWSDHGSNQLWDTLQQDEEGMLGIVTASRSAETDQQQPADKRIHLGPLDHESATALLQNAASRWNAPSDLKQILELIKISRGNAFRLQELAEEFRPGGFLNPPADAIETSVAELGDVDKFWKTRFERLTDSVRSVLTFIVTARAPVSIAQLAALTGLDDQVDVCVSKLVEQRLVQDDATGEECISVMHDKIAAGLIGTLTKSQLDHAHRAWAELLSSQNRPRDFSARIASHYYEAGDVVDALPFAILAADIADRAYAKAEAAEWHERILDQVAGAARSKHLREAARCYHEAYLPQKAAELYLLVAAESDDKIEQLRFQTLALQLFIRSGQMNQARPLMKTLESKLDLGHTGHSSVMSHGVRLAAISRSLGERRPITDHHESSNDEIDNARLEFCAAVTRPLALLDFRYMIRLVSRGADLADCGGEDCDRVHFGVMATVLRGFLQGPGADLTDELYATLDQPWSGISEESSRRINAELSAGKAFLDLLSMEWQKIPFDVDDAIRDYAFNSNPARFEVLHTRWLRIWADWHLGRWGALRVDAEEMLEDAGRRNDAYQRLLATSGYGGNALLMSDRSSACRRLAKRNSEVGAESGGVELAGVLRWMDQVQLDLYVGDLSSAANAVLEMRRKMSTSLLERVDFIRAIVDHLSGLVSLHVRQQLLSPDSSENPIHVGVVDPEIVSPTFVLEAIRRLMRQRAGYPRMLASLLLGIHRRLEGRSELARRSFVRAHARAGKMGLMPYELAAEDGLNDLAKNFTDSLRQRMVNHDIRKPAQLERLYTVAPIAPEED